MPPGERETGAVRNQIKYEYNDFGALVKEYQDHEGSLDGNTLYVQYDYDTAAKGWRLKSVRYPNERLVHYAYTTTGDVNVADKLSRLSGIRAARGGGSRVPKLGTSSK